MPECALPPHLRGRLHNDWPWPFNKISRSSNAFGARCGKGKPGYMAWPPKLIEGFDVTRWENTGATSIVWLVDLVGKTFREEQIYSRYHRAIEMNEGNPNFRKEIQVYIPFWAETKVWDEPHPDDPKYFIQKCDPNFYSPSALQKFSMGKGYMKTDPKYRANWKMIRKREWPWEEKGPHGIMKPDAEDLVLFHRDNFRPDHLDAYYNGPGVLPIGYLGLHWE